MSQVLGGALAAIRKVGKVFLPQGQEALAIPEEPKPVGKGRAVTLPDGRRFLAVE